MADTDGIASVVTEPENISNNAGNSEEVAMAGIDANVPVGEASENISNNAGNSEEAADLNVNNNATLKSGKRTVAPRTKKAVVAPQKKNVAAKVSNPAKKNSKAAKVAMSHPKYSDMVVSAIVALKARQGSSRQAIVKYIETNYKVGDSVALLVRKALKKGLETGELVATKGVGAAGSFRLAKVEKKAAPKVAKKPKPATPKKKALPAKKKTPMKKSPAAKKTVVKKTKSPVKKQVARKSPAKKNVGPKKAQAPTKAVTKKTQAKKKTPAPTKKNTPKKKVASKKK